MDMPHTFETNGDEGVRQVFPADDVYMKLRSDIRRYEGARHDTIYDQHISYARSIAKNIADGMSLEYVMSVISIEIVHFNMDILQTVQLTNHFLGEHGRPERLDQFLNIVNQDVPIMSSGMTPELMAAYAASKSEREKNACEQLAKAAARHMTGPTVPSMVIEFMKADLMHDQLDNVLFVECLNEELERSGVLHRFNQYLEQVDI